MGTTADTKNDNSQPKKLPAQNRADMQREAVSISATMKLVEVRPRIHRQIKLGIAYPKLEDANFFIDTWRWVWRRLPLGDRRRLLKYWRGNGVGL